MKAFFERYSYESMRMLLNQVAMTIFGFALALTSVTAENDTLLLFTSIGAVIFYMVLNYGVAWRVGSRDKITVDRGMRVYNPAIGLLISLVANSLNFVMAILGMIGSLAGIGGLETFGENAALWGQGMYQGILAVIELSGEALNEYWWVYFLLPLPSLLVSMLGYMAGVKDFHITSMGVPEMPESDRPTKAEVKAKKKEERTGRENKS